MKKCDNFTFLIHQAAVFQMLSLSYSISPARYLVLQKQKQEQKWCLDGSVCRYVWVWERVEYAIECVYGRVCDYRRDKVKDGQKLHNDQMLPWVQIFARRSMDCGLTCCLNCDLCMT